MKSVVIVGSGQLGSRHLQAIGKVNDKLKIFVIDKNREALSIAENRFREVNSSNDICFDINLDIIPKSIDFLVIATNSKVRFSIIEEIIHNCEIKNLILEKVLFQIQDEYDKSKKLLKENNISAWVNCPRRMYPIYNEIKRILDTANPTEVRVSGGDWNLACNGIHFLDLFNFLTGRIISSIKDIESQIANSKRDGYKEVSGKFIGKSHFGDVLHMESLKGSTVPVSIIIENNYQKIVVLESLGKAYIFSNDKWIEQKFEILYQSNLTNLVYKEINETNSCSLTDFDISKDIHMPFIQCLTQVFSRNGIEGCPIT